MTFALIVFHNLYQVILCYWKCKTEIVSRQLYVLGYLQTSYDTNLFIIAPLRHFSFSHINHPPPPPSPSFSLSPAPSSMWMLRCAYMWYMSMCVKKRQDVWRCGTNCKSHKSESNRFVCQNTGLTTWHVFELSHVIYVDNLVFDDFYIESQSKTR